MNERSIQYNQHFKGRRALVTGAAGFIGSHIVETLVALGAEVVALDDLTHGDWNNLAGFGDGAEQITASITDAEAMHEAARGCAYVFHLAGFGSVPRSMKRPELYLDANAIGTWNVLEASRHAGVQRVVFSGSSNYYGNWGDPEEPCVEHQPPMPLNPYAATKVFGESCMRAWANSFGLDTCVLRYFNIFGPRQNPNSDYAAVVVAFAKALHAGQPPAIYGDGEQSRDFTHVANAVHANLLAASRPEPLRGEPFNAAAGGRRSVNELYEAMARLFGREDLTPVHHPARGGEVRHCLADITKARRTLGYEPIVDFTTGLAETIDWYRRYFDQTT